MRSDLDFVSQKCAQSGCFACAHARNGGGCVSSAVVTADTHKVQKHRGATRGTVCSFINALFISSADTLLKSAQTNASMTCNC